VSVYKFSESLAKAKKENYIERVVTKNNDVFIQSFNTTINIGMLLGYIVDKSIELKYALLEFQHLPANNNNPLYWKDKNLTLIIGVVNNPLEHNTKEYIIQGGVARVKIPMLEYIESNKNIGLVLHCSNNYTSRKPNDITVNDNAPIALPFELVSLKLYYNYK